MTETDEQFEERKKNNFIENLKNHTEDLEFSLEDHSNNLESTKKLYEFFEGCDASHFAKKKPEFEYELRREYQEIERDTRLKAMRVHMQKLEEIVAKEKEGVARNRLKLKLIDDGVAVWNMRDEELESHGN